MKSTLLLLVCLGIGITASAQRSGIKGQLYWLPPDSNFKPKQQNIPYDGIPLEIFVHELTSQAEVDREDGVISKIHTPVASRFFCNWNGSFKAKLPPGKYSVFVKYKNGFFGNLQDADKNLSPAIVAGKRKNAWITITINYSSYY